MPKNWLYFIALALPFALRLAIFNTGFVEWLWYSHYEHAYYALSSMRASPYFNQFIGGWPLPVFCITVWMYWHIDDHMEGIAEQFLLLPIAYIPFTIVGDIMQTGQFHSENLYIHPLVILPAGYAYVLLWVIFIWILDKLRLVM